MADEQISVAYLEKLYTALQQLSTADANKIMAAVHNVDALLSPAARLEAPVSAHESKERKVQLVMQIVSLLEANRMMCEKSLETLYKFVQVLKKSVAYDNQGKFDSASSVDVNISV